MIRDPDCVLCRLGGQATAPNTCVVGIGPSRPQVMVVSRLPLSDKRRDELDEMLRTVGITSVYHTAANRCRTWELEPNKSDIKKCRTWLDAEIAAVGPQLIVPLGNEALLSVTGRSGIMKYRGQTLEHRPSGTPAIATISPAMVSRNPGLRAGLLADLAYIRRVADGSEGAGASGPRVHGVYTGKGVRALRERLEAADGFACDIESNGFDEHRADGRLLSVAFTLWDPGDEQPRDVWAVPLAHPESPFVRDRTWLKILRYLWPAMARVPRRVLHNGKFDLRWLHQYGLPLELTFDTMLAAHLLDENRPKSLDSLARTLLGAAPWKIDNKTLIDQSLKRVLWYNGMDTWHTAGLYFPLRQQLVEQPRLAKLMKKMMVPASNEFVRIERRGIWTDREKLYSHGAISRRTLAEIDAELLEYVPDRESWPANVKEVNFNPSNFARWWLFEHLGYPVLGRGKTKEDGSPGDPSMAESIMLKLQADHPDDRVLQLMIERTKWQKYSSAFFAAYEEQIDDEDRIHTTFKLTGTVTGRLSSGKGDDDKVTGRVQNRGVNLQQVPRDDFVRGIFGAPPGSVFVECDYSQVELRVAAFLAREQTMLSLYRTGQDIHMTMAMRMTGKPAGEVTKEERKKAKAVNFGFLYGMGWKKFIETAWSNYGVVVTEAEAKIFRRAFFEQFPDLPRWHQRQRSLALKYQRVQSPLGRVRHLPDIMSANDDVRHEAERQAINSPVQSFASDMCLMSLVSLSQKFRELGLRAHSVGTVHDAINFEVPLGEVAAVVPLIRETMENLPLQRDYGVVLDVPIVADAKIGTRWGSAKEVPGDVSCRPVRLQEWLRDHAEEVGVG